MMNLATMPTTVSELATRSPRRFAAMVRDAVRAAGCGPETRVHEARGLLAAALARADATGDTTLASKIELAMALHGRRATVH